MTTALMEKIKGLGPGSFYNRRERTWEPPWDFLNVIQRFHGEELAQDFRQRPGALWAGVLPQSFLRSRQFGPFAAAFPGVGEIMSHTFYHYRAYQAAGYVERVFFGETHGSATNGYADTNMTSASKMAGGEAMLVRSIRVHFIPDPTDYDVAEASPTVSFGEGMEILEDRCHLEFKIGDKPYLTAAPLLLFPAGMGPGTMVRGSLAANGIRGNGYPNSGSPDQTSLYECDPPILILPTQSFAVTLRWVVAQAVTTAGTTRLGVLLDGLRVRSVQ